MPQNRFLCRAAVGAMLLLLALPLTSVAQSQPAAGPPSVQARDSLTGISGGVEVRRDRFDYHFDNPSSFNTASLVPHYFEQTYDADNLWVTGRAGYRAGGRLLETEFGFSLPTQSVASDYDTFFLPDGDVVVYGTSADTDLWSWRAAQFVGLGAWRGIEFRAGYAYRRDRSIFHDSVSTTTHTKPPSSSSFWNTNRETTISEVHQVLLGAGRVVRSHAWTARARADVAPTALARLTTILPDKYDEPIVFMAKGLTLNATLDVTRTLGRWSVGGRVDYAHAWSYSSASQFNWNGLGGQVVIGYR